MQTPNLKLPKGKDSVCFLYSKNPTENKNIKDFNPQETYKFYKRSANVFNIIIMCVVFLSDISASFVI